jgi:5-formyltetrahydrofolate cyclo-ligase
MQPLQHMNKSLIRKQENARRMALNEDQLAVLNQKLLERFTTLDFQQIHTLHIFLPIAEKNEPDTFMFIRWLQINYPGIHLIVPKADFNTFIMTHHSYGGEEELQKNLYQIPEPTADSEYTGTIDMVIVPLLAFDDRGYRVGYGKGFYDRFLGHHSAVKIGVSFFESIQTITDVHADDIKLDYCITPEKVYRFKQ